MHIESDTPLGMTAVPDLTIEVTTVTGQHASTPLDYESWDYHASAQTFRIKAYDAHGSSVIVTLSEVMLLEMVFGRIHADET